MKYVTPELVVLGSAATLVQGDILGEDDNVLTFKTQPPAGVTLGLDE